MLLLGVRGRETRYETAVVACRLSVPLPAKPDV